MRAIMTHLLANRPYMKRNNQPLSRQTEEESIPVSEETGLSHGISGMAHRIKRLDVIQF